MTGLPQHPSSFPSDSSSSNSSSCDPSELIELYWCEMARRKNEKITRAMTLNIGSDGTLSQEDDSWKDTEYLFVRGENKVNKEYYFRDFS